MHGKHHVQRAVHTRQVKGGEEWSALSDIKAVHVSVTANSATVPYTSLRKDAIAHREVNKNCCCPRGMWALFRLWRAVCSESID